MQKNSGCLNCDHHFKKSVDNVVNSWRDKQPEEKSKTGSISDQVIRALTDSSVMFHMSGT